MKVNISLQNTRSPGYVAKRIKSFTVKAYPYRNEVYSNIAPMDEITAHGSKIRVCFTQDSNQMAVESLKHLSENIACGQYPEGSTRIYVVGQLYDGICQLNNPLNEEYQEFRMDSWYIKTPFAYDANFMKHYSDPPSDDVTAIPLKIVKKKSLTYSDFIPFPGRYQ